MPVTNAVAYKLSDFEYWSNGYWIGVTSDRFSNAMRGYFRLKQNAVPLQATITDDDPYLNDITYFSEDPNDAAAEEQGALQHIAIKNASGRTIYDNGFSIDSASMNVETASDPGSGDPTALDYEAGEMDIYHVLSYSNATPLGNQGLSGYLIYGGALPQKGVIYHGGTTNRSATEDDSYGFDGTVYGQSYDNLLCFVAGTMIETDSGPRPVEEIAQGDLVRTKDRGLKPVQWISRRSFRVAGVADAEKIYPVRIRAGALGQGLPVADMYLSQQHRVLLKSPIARRMTGGDEVLVAAKKLLDIEGVELVRDCDEVTYVHFLFDRHEIVYSNGAETEALFTGPEAMASIGQAARDEIYALFPELAKIDFKPRPARFVPSGKQLRRLISRHIKNDRRLYSA
ncbi:Hint domain-containing protein [Paracoccus sp. SCSIO 75233]|uniref:Hint domain-containing protein n=1 Tax=Paracoccus sp. SCSIO 75233 TaxID=3017782 RepID=UPI0022F134FD|nr:Hint domain-containing protein [Paracoccus sp. SCSIO 75233]WBU53184.1 Hint domain-containing protein [Paracoccus sp. SCSIO 75233]